MAVLELPQAPGHEAAHPDGLELSPRPDRPARLVGWLFAATGIVLVLVMGLLGLAMRFAQAEALGLSPDWFYRVMTLHGAGMLSGALMAMMGGLWYAVKPFAPLSLGRMLFSYAALLVGAVAVVVAVLVGGFAPGWTFLMPLPFEPANAWQPWATATFLGGMVLVGVGFFVYCVDMLGAVTRAYGGFRGALGWRLLRDASAEAPPPQVVAATAITAQGMLTGAIGTTILAALLGRALDAQVVLDALWAKNLTYFFGHSVANLIVYLAAGTIYVLLPRYAGRPWKTTRALVAGWLATLVFVTTAYFHHLYMDFAQPEALSWIGMAASSGAAVPVAVVTIYTGMVLVWGSRYRWTLASILIYLGFAGWAIGGVGAVIDSLIPVNFRFHNTLWVPAHFHTYLMLGVVFWALAFLAYLLERAARGTRWGAQTKLGVAAMLLGGYGLVGSWYVSGAASVPRRYAEHAGLFPGAEAYSAAASGFAVTLAAGILMVLWQFGALARDALRGRRRAAGAAEPAPPVPAGGAEIPLEPPLRGNVQRGLALICGAAATFALLPEVSRWVGTDVQLHHLQHAGQLLVGLSFGALFVSSPGYFPARPSPGLSWLGLILVLAAPVAMLLAMVPSVYGSFEGSETTHLIYHLGMISLGGLTGIGASLLGRVPARLLLVLALGMAVLYAGGAGA